MVIDAADEVFEFKIGQKDIPVWIFGAQNKKTILLIHGYPHAFSSYFGDLPVAYLKKNYRLITCDLPGFGVSKSVKMKPTIFIQKLLEELEISDKVVVFGLSYGGVVALQFANTHPEHVAGVILGGTPHFKKSVQMVMKPAAFSIKLFKRHLSELLSSFSHVSEEFLGQLKTPVLLLYSSKDSVGKQSMGKQLNSLIPNSSLFITRNRTHAWLMHRIDESGFLKEIEDFLKQIKFRA